MNGKSKIKATALMTKETVKLVIKNFFDHNVGKNGAALAYYLLFAIFPLLIFVSNLIGQLELDVYSITRWMTGIFPQDVVSLFEAYLEYVSLNSSNTLLGFSLIFSVYFPFRAAKSLMYDVRRAYRLGEPEKPISFAFRQCLYTLVLLLVIALSLAFSTFGRRLLNYIIGRISIKIPTIFITLWNYLRFLLIGLVVFIAVSVLYAISQDTKQRWSAILPGAVIALFAWLAVSVAFSFYVESFAKYSVIYGTLGTVIVLMLWLYITAVILILGAEFNQALKDTKNNAQCN